MKKKFGFGSLSFILAILAFVWDYSIKGFYLGDKVLYFLKIPSWSNNVTMSGIHYTVFYSFLLLIPSILLSIKFKQDFLSQVGKWISIILSFVLIVSLFFLIFSSF